MLHNLGVRIAGVVAGSAMILATAFNAEAAPRRHYGGGGNGGAVAALAFGAIALGVGAAIASGQRSERHYVTAAPYGYGGGYGGYGYAPQPQYYATQQQYYAPQVHYVPQPQYYAPQPVYNSGYGHWYGARHRHEGNRWQRLARDRQQYGT